MPLPPAQDPEPAAHRDLDPHHALPPAAVTDSSHLLPASTEEPPAKGSLARKLIVLTVILAAIAFAVWRIYVNKNDTVTTNSRAAAAANRPTPVLVSVVQQKTVPVYLTALGTVTAYNTVTLHSRVDGQLLKVNFKEGQAVREGQLLLQIDPRPYQATVAQAQGQLAKDEANQKNAQAEAQRYTALYQAGVVSKESQQTQISNEGQAAGSIAADNAAIQAAKVNLSYTSIYSPITGVVGLRGVDPGNIVHASDSTGLVVITQIHPIAVIFTLPEDQLPQVQEAMHGSRLVVEAYDRNDSHKIASGTLLTMDNQIDTTTGTAKLKAVFDNTDDALFPNQFVNIRLVLRERPNATVVPTAAIQSGTQGTFVFVVHPGPTPANKMTAESGAGAGAGQHRGGRKPAGDGGAPPSGGGAPGGGAGGDAAAANAPKFHVDAVQVHVDFAQGSNSVLSDGALNSGDQVVIDGQEKLIDGSNVSPTRGNPPGATGKGVGASGATAPAAQPGSTPDSSMPSATPQPGQGQSPNGGHHRGGGGKPGSGGGTGNGGGEAE